MLTNEQAKEFSRRAKISAGKYGFTEHAEDIAQDVLLHFSSGKGRHQTIDQAVLDAIRRDFGRPGTPNFDQRQCFNSPERLDDPDCSITDRHLEIESGELRGDFERLTQGLKGIERACIILKFKWGFTQKEISDCFGVTESRISQRVARMETSLHSRMEVSERRTAPVHVEALPTQRERIQTSPAPREKGPRQQESPREISRNLQARPSLYQKANAIVERVREETRTQVEQGEIKEVQKALLETFNVNSF